MERVAKLTLEKQLFPLWQKISEDKRLVATRPLVAAAILKTYLESGACFLGSEEIGKLAGVSHVTVSRSIKDLVKRGYMRRTGHCFEQGIEPIHVADPKHLTLPFPPVVTFCSPDGLGEGTKASRLMAKIEADTPLRQATRNVARAILTYHEATGRHLSRNTVLAKMVGCSVQTAAHAKESLAARGYFTWSRATKRRSGPLIPRFEEDEMHVVDRQHQESGYSLTPSEKFDPAKTVGFDGSGVFTARCGKCDAEIQAGHSRDRRLPPEAVLQMFRKKGWHVHLRKPKLNVCDKCLNPPKQVIKEEIVMPPVLPVAMPNGAAPPLPRALTPIESRKVNALLEAHFDTDRGRYEPAWDDEHVAIEANAPRASVTKFRDEAYGRLKTFDDIEKVLNDLHTLKAMADELEKQVIVIRNKRLVL